MLPLFQEDSKSVAMIKHAMSVIQQAVNKLNPGQAPVIALDQPLFAIGKQVQWRWPDTYGEQHFVLLLGGLHIELAALKMIGTWLEDSGWVDILAQSGIATPGVAQAFFVSSHISRTRRAHLITACALYYLMLRAYHSAMENVNAEEKPTLEDWCRSRKAASPHFHYWLLTLELQLLIYSCHR